MNDPYETLMQQGLLACFLNCYSYGYGHTNHGVVTCTAEHVTCVFPENIITRFDVSVNDVSKEFAEMLRINLILNLPKLLKTLPIYAIMKEPN